MAYTITNELCLLLELLGYCALGLMPALIGFWRTSSPFVLGACLCLSYYFIDTFTPRQLFWAYTITGPAWWIRSRFCEYADTVKNFRPGAPPPSFRDWCAAMALTAVARVDVLKPPRVRPDEFSYLGYITSLSKRQGRRPRVNNLIPARQLDQKHHKPCVISQTHLLSSSR
jgi:hypothetical protein